MLTPHLASARVLVHNSNMASPLFRRLAVVALVLVVVTLIAIDFTFTSYVARQKLSLDPAAASATRREIAAIALGAFVLGLAIAFGVSRSLSRRVAGLKGLVQSLPGGDAADRAPAPSGDDLGSLENSLAGVAMGLQRLLDRLEFESARREAILAC